jgi:fermentation-respiration switch protein FrsA (DUF1100 family)
VSLIAIAVIVYLLLGIVLYVMQERMVFLAGLPGRALEATPRDVGFEYDDVHLETADGVSLHHGNAGNISHRLDSIAIFRELGFNVFIIDYRGYGRSEGRPSEQGTYRDAEAAWQHLVAERGEAPSRIVIFGRSIGGGVAAWLAARRTAAALIVESSFTSAVDMAKRLYPFMPVRLLSRLEYPVVDYLASVASPVLIVHSRDDEIIPFYMGKALYEAAPTPKAFLELRGDHNMGFLLSGGHYRDGLRAFIEDHLGKSAGPGN